MKAREYDLEDRLVAYKDFLHTMGVCLEELRESRIWLRIIARRSLLNDTELSPVLNETEESIRIFKAGIATAKRNDST